MLFRSGIPLQMGEFTAYDTYEKWVGTLELLNNSEWHWTSWTYKVWGGMSWGIFNITSGGAKVNPRNDSYAEILEKFKNLRTENTKKYSFGNGKTLYSVLKEYLTGITQSWAEITKIGLKEENGKVYAVFGGNCTVSSKADLESYVIDAEISGRVKLNLVVAEYNSVNGTFILKAEISKLANGRHYLHAGFDAVPPNLPASSAVIDEANKTVTAGGKVYSLGEEWGCRQIIVSNS